MVKNTKLISKYIKLYKCLFIQELKIRISYRFDFFIGLTAMVTSSILGFFSFWIIFLNFPSIKGFSFNDILFFYGFYLISITPSQIFFSNNWNLANKVFTGDFIKYCTKPINTFFYYYSETYDINGIFQGLMGIGILVYAWAKLNISVSFMIIIFTLFQLISASLILISIMNIAASMSFIMINSDSLLDLTNKIKEYAKYPISVFNNFFTIVFSTILPIGFISYYPSMLLLENKEISFWNYLTPVMGILDFYLSYKIWMKLSKICSGTGT